MFQSREYIYAVYQEQSFSKAAKKLFISQPSLSATVKRVENRVGYPIFDRGTKPLGLTECGAKYIESVERMMQIEREFSDFVNDWGGLKIGKLVLGGSSLFSSWVLPPLIAAFTSRFPFIQVELIEESTAELATLLQEGKIDLVIDNCELDSVIFDRVLYQEEYLLLAVPKHFASHKELAAFAVPIEQVRDGSFLSDDTNPVPLVQFCNEPFIMLKPENDTGKRAMDILQKHAITPTVLFALDQQMTSYNITCSGMGISFISDTLIKRVPAHPDVAYYKLAEENSGRNIYFYWKAGKYFSRATEEFLKIATSDIASDLIAMGM